MIGREGTFRRRHPVLRGTLIEGMVKPIGRLVKAINLDERPSGSVRPQWPLIDYADARETRIVRD